MGKFSIFLKGNSTATGLEILLTLIAAFGAGYFIGGEFMRFIIFIILFFGIFAIYKWAEFKKWERERKKLYEGRKMTLKNSADINIPNSDGLIKSEDAYKEVEDILKKEFPEMYE